MKSYYRIDTWIDTDYDYAYDRITVYINLHLEKCKLYDLIEQKEKEITYVTYLNYHDET